MTRELPPLDDVLYAVAVQYAAAEQSLASPLRAFPCGECRHVSSRYSHICHHPLIDVEREHTTVDWQVSKGYYPSPGNWPLSQLCGREKLLWEPIPAPPPPPVPVYRAWLQEAWGPYLRLVLCMTGGAIVAVCVIAAVV